MFTSITNFIISTKAPKINVHINSPYKSRVKSKRADKLKVLESPIINNNSSTSNKKSPSIRKYIDRLFRRKDIEFESGFGEFKFNLLIFQTTNQVEKFTTIHQVY